MCKEGNIEDAVKYVQSMPLDALNIVVWNTLISQAGHVKRFRLAHEVYTDVSCFTPLYIAGSAARESLDAVLRPNTFTCFGAPQSLVPGCTTFYIG